jgi:hypothetical protein
VVAVAEQHLDIRPVLLLVVAQAGEMVVVWLAYILAELVVLQDNREAQGIAIKVISLIMEAVEAAAECFQEPAVQDEIFQINPMAAAPVVAVQPTEQMVVADPEAVTVTPARIFKQAVAVVGALEVVMLQVAMPVVLLLVEPVAKLLT